MVGRYRENTQEIIRPCLLLISGWKIQGKYLEKHQTLGIIDQWLEETGKILSKLLISGWKKQGKYSGKHQALGIIDQWLEDTGKILRKASDLAYY